MAVGLVPLLTASMPTSAAAAAAASFTNSGPVFQTQAFAYEPGMGKVSVPSLPTEKTYQTGALAGQAGEEGDLAVAPNGDVFINTATGGLIASYDQGTTWQTITPPPGCAGTGYDHTVAYDAGRLFFTSSDTPLVNFSDDNGATWSSTCGKQAPGAEESWNADRANIFAGPASPEGTKPTTSFPDVAYYCGQSVKGNDEPGTFFTLCEHSFDGGATWTNANEPVFTEPLNGCDAVANGGRWTPDISGGTVGPDGTVYIAKQFCGEPYLAMSRDNGNTWTRVQVSPHSNVGITSGQYGGYEQGIAADKYGDVFFTWIGANGLPYLAVSRDHGKTWSKPIMYAAPGVNTAFWPFISLDSQGRLDMIYMGTSAASYSDTSAQWFEYMAEMPNPMSGAHPLIYSATTTPPSYPWYTGAGGPDRAPLNCGCDYVGEASAANGGTWGMTFDNGSKHLGVLGSVLIPPPATTKSGQ